MTQHEYVRKQETRPFYQPITACAVCGNAVWHASHTGTMTQERDDMNNRDDETQYECEDCHNVYTSGYGSEVEGISVRWLCYPCQQIRADRKAGVSDHG